MANSVVMGSSVLEKKKRHYPLMTESANTPKRYFPGSDGEVIAQAVSPLRLLFALAWFNSVSTDGLPRFMVQININKT
jgi:hypothetical protein